MCPFTLNSFEVFCFQVYSSAEMGERKTPLLCGFNQLCVGGSESQRGPCKNCDLCFPFSLGGLEPLQCLEAFC